MKNNKLLTTLILSTLTAVSFGVDEAQADHVANPASDDLSSITFSGVTTDGDGGVFIYDGSGTAGTQYEIDGKTFTNNTATGNGGAIYNSSANTQKVTIKNTTFTGNTAAQGKDIYNAGTMEFQGNVTFSTTTNNDSLYNAGAITNNGALSGNVTNKGTFTNNSTYSGNLINENGGSFTSAINNILGTNDIENYGTLTISGSTGENAALENTHIIKNTADDTKGSLVLSGNITNSKAITQKNVSNSGNLTNNAKITATKITNTGVITSSADNIAAELSGGTYNVTGGAIATAISNSATVSVQGDTTLNNANLLSNAGTVSISDGKKLTVLAGAISKAISGGTVEITGDADANTSIAAAVTSAIKVATGGVLTASNAANLSSANTLTNDGELIIGGGELTKAVTQTGTAGKLTIKGTGSVINADVTQAELNVAASQKTTINAGNTVTVTTTLSNSGEIANNGTLTLQGSDMTNGGTISATSGKGLLNIEGKLTNTAGKSIAQKKIDVKSGGTLSANISDLSISELGNANTTTTLTGGDDNTHRASINFAITGDGTTTVDKFATNTVAQAAGGTLAIASTGDLLNNNVDISKNISNSGTLTSNASYIKGTVTGGTYNITGGAIGTAITNSIVNITGNTSVASVADLMSAASISNTGSQLTIGGGEITKTIAGAGTTIIDGTVTISDSLGTAISNAITVNSGKQLTAKAGKFGNTVTNKGTLNLTGGAISKSILDNATPSGTLNIKDTVTVSDNASITQNKIVIENAKSLTNGGTGAITAAVENSGALTSSAIVGTVENKTTASTYTVTSGTIGSAVTGSGTTIINGADVQATASIANAITVNGSMKLTIGADNVDGAVTNNGTVDLNAGTLEQAITGGVLNIKGAVSTGAANLAADTINNNTTNNQLTLTGGTLSKAISGANGKTIIADNVEANASIANKITVNSSKKLTIAAGNVGNSVTNNGTVDLNAGTLGQTISGGTLNIKGAVSTGAANLAANTINNNTTDNELTLTGGTLSKAISGANGKTIIADNVEANASIANKITVNSTKKLTIGAGNVGGAVTNNGIVDLNAGTLGQTITGGVLNIKGAVSTGAANLAADTINNDITDNALTLNGGTLSKAISGANGKTIIAGDVESSASIANKITVNSSKKLTIGASNVDGAVTNNGTVDLNAGTLEQAITGGTLNILGAVSTGAANLAANTINNNTTDNELTLTGGTLSKAISGGGTTVIAGDVESSASIANKITVNSTKKLTIAAGNVGNSVTNNGTVDLNAGTLGQTISGGTLNILGAVSTGAANLAANTINNNTTDNALTLNGGTLAKGISGANGKTIINGAVTVNNSTAIQNKVVINSGSGKSLQTSAANLQNTVTNNGLLTLTDGTISNAIDGSGNLTITGTSVKAGADVQSGTLTVGDSQKFTVNNGKTATVTNTLANTGEIALDGAGAKLALNTASSMTNGSNITGTGKVEINTALTNNGSISSAIDILSGSLESSLANLGTNAAVTNNASLIAHGGTTDSHATNAHAISGTGSVSFDGFVDNSASIALTGSGKISNTGTLSSSASNIASIVENSGTYILNGAGTIANAIKNISGSGAGKTQITSTGVILGSGANIANSVEITSTGALSTAYAALFDSTVKNDGSLTLSGGTLDQAVTGSGNLTVSGTSVQAGANIAQKSLTLANAADEFQINSSKTVTVSDTLSNSGKIKGAGTFIVNGDLTNAGSILSAIKVEESKKLISTVAGLNADGITAAIANAGTLQLTGGADASHKQTNTRNITGVTASGSTTLGGLTVSGFVQNSGNITQTSFENTGTFENTGSITATITNAGTLNSAANLLNATDNIITNSSDSAVLNLTGGSLTKSIASSYTNSKTTLTGVTLDAAKLGTDTDNKGKVEIIGTDTLMSGTLSKDLIGSGTVKINSSLALADGVDITGGLNFNGGTLNLDKNNDTDYHTSYDYNAHDVGSVTGNGSLRIAVDMQNSKADSLKITGTGSDATIDLTTIHINQEHAKDKRIGTQDDYLTFLSGSAIDDITLKLNGSETGKITSYTTNYKYEFTLGSDGKLNVKTDEGSNALADYISASTGTGSSFDLFEDIVVETNAYWNAPNDPLITTGAGNTLDINLQGHDITGDTNASGTAIRDGIIVTNATSTNAMKLDGGGADSSSMSNFKTAVTVNEGGQLETSNITISDNTTGFVNNGKLSLENVKFSGNSTSDVQNNNALELKGDNTINKAITMTGGLAEDKAIVTISGGTTTIEGGAGVTQNKVKISNSSAELKANANDINTAIDNGGTVTLSGGTITKDILGYSDSLKGTLSIQGNMNIGNSGDTEEVQIKQGIIEIGSGSNTGVQLKNYGHMEGKLTNYGTLYNNSKNTVKITADSTNSGTITYDSGADSHLWISGATLTNTGAITQEILTIDTGSKIENSIAGSSLTVDTALTNNGTITNNGNLYLKGNKYSEIDGLGNVSTVGSSMKNTGTIDGTGTTYISGSLDSTSGTVSTSNLEISSGGALTINAANLTSNTITNNATDGITLKGGALAKTIGGTGSTVIDGTVSFADSIATAIANTVTVKSGKLTTNADKLGNTVTNKAELELTGGAIAHAITDTAGTLDINGAVTVSNNSAITQNKIVIENAKSLTNGGTGAITAAVENSGALTSSAIVGTVENKTTASTYTVTSGTIGSAVTGSGTTIIDGDDVKANASIANAITVNGSKKLTIGAGNVDGAVTNSGTVDLKAGTLEQVITGGTVNILEAVSTNANNLRANTIENDSAELKLTGGTVTKDLTGSGLVNIDTGDTAVSVTNQAAIRKAIKVTSGTFANTTGSVDGNWTIDDGAVATNAANNAIAQVDNSGTFSLLAGSGAVATINNKADNTPATQGVNQADGSVDTVNNYSRYEQTGGNATTVNNGDAANGAGAYTISAGTIGTITDNHANSTLALSGTGSIANVINTKGKVTQTGGSVTTKVTNTDRYEQSAGTVVEVDNSSSYTLSGTGSVTTFNNNLAAAQLEMSAGTITTLNNNLGTVQQSGGSVTTKVVNTATYTQTGGSVKDVDNGSASAKGSYSISNGSITGTISNLNDDSTIAISQPTGSTTSVTKVDNQKGKVTQSGGTVAEVVNGTTSEYTQTGGSATKVNNAGKYNLNGSSSTIGTYIQDNATGNLTIDGGAALTISGTESTLSAGSVTLGSSTPTASVGTLNIQKDSTAKLTTVGASVLSVTNNSKLQTTAGSSIVAASTVSVASGSTLDVNGAGTQVAVNSGDSWLGDITVQGGQLDIGDIATATRTGNLKQTGGTVNVKSAQTFITGDSVTDGVFNIDEDLTMTGGTITAGASNATVTIAAGKKFDIQGGDVTLDGGADLSKVTWAGEVDLNGGNLVLKNIKDVTRVAAGADSNKTGKLNAQTGNLTIDNSTVLLGNNDVIATAVTLTLLNSSNITVGTGADVQIDAADVATWADGGTVTQEAGTLKLNGVTTTDADPAKAVSVIANGGELSILGTTILNNGNDKIASGVTLKIEEGNTLDIKKTSADGVTLNTGDTWTGSILQEGGVVTMNGRGTAAAPETTTATKKYNMTGGTLNLENSNLKLATTDSKTAAGTINLKTASSLTYDNGATDNTAIIVSDSTADKLIVGGTNNTTLQLLTGSDVKGTTGISILGTGTLKSASDYIKGAVTNDGNYELTGGTIAGAINNAAGNGTTGTVTLLGTNSSTSAGVINQANIVVGDGTNAAAFTMGANTTANTKYTVNANATVNNGTGTKIVAQTLDNKGTITGVTASGTTTYGDLQVNNGGSSTGNITQNNINIAGTFVNKSAMEAKAKLTNTGTLQTSAAITANTFDNSGTIDGVTESGTTTYGSLTVANGGKSTGAIVLDTLTLTAGSFDNDEDITVNNTFTNGSILDNAATKTIKAGTMSSSNKIVNAGIITGVTPASSTLTNTGVIENAGEISIIVNNNHADATITNTGSGTLGKVSGNIGTITSSANGLTGDIVSDNLINLEGGTLTVAIKNAANNINSGTININDDLIIANPTATPTPLAGSIKQKDIVVADGKDVTNKKGGSIEAQTMKLTNGTLELEAASVTKVSAITIDAGTLSLVDSAVLDPSSNVTINNGYLQLTAKDEDVTFHAPVAPGSTYGIIADSSRSTSGKKVTIDIAINARDLTVTGIDAYPDSVQGSILDLGAAAINSLNTSPIPIRMGKESQLSLNSTDTVAGTHPNVVFKAESVTGSDYTLNINNDLSPSTVTLDASTQGAKQVNVKAGILEIIDSTVLGTTPINLQDNAGTGTSTVELDATDVIELASNLTGASTATAASHKVIINNQDTIQTAGATPTEGLVKVISSLTNVAVDAQKGELWLAKGSSVSDDSTVITRTGTTLNVENNTLTNYQDNFTLEDNALIKVDAHLTSGRTDNFLNAQQQGNVILEEYNPLNAEWIVHDFAEIDLPKALGIDSSKLIYSANALAQHPIVMTPIRKLQGQIDADQGKLFYYRTGNEYEDFNPSIYASSVAAQLGGYLTQLDAYNEAFSNMDMYMLMTREQRQAMKFANKYAAADSNLIFSTLSNPNVETSGWFRPYSTFEKVNLNRGTKVSNVAWGTFGGLESGLFDLSRGWDGNFGVYVGYNGSHQAYQGNSIYQNGATLGVVGYAYKNNYFIGSTINGGGSIASANIMYGNEDFNMAMAGAAVKTGYNWELAKGKFIIQPSFQTSYSFVNTFDFNNAAGVRVKSDPLHAIQVEPQIKLIGNFKNGWQPYAHLSGVWTIMDEQKIMANDVSLPELSVKPYARYGLGIRKTFGDRATGFFQTFFTSGGRNGMGLQLGFNIKLGESPKKQKAKPQYKKMKEEPTANVHKKYIIKKA